jgi:hypothetical protein
MLQKVNNVNFKICLKTIRKYWYRLYSDLLDLDLLDLDLLDLDLLDLRYKCFG